MDRTPSSHAELFENDDLEFRTITTLLHTLRTHERINVQNFQVSRHERLYLKLLTSLSSLLVRNHEVVTVMPKRSAQGTTVFVGSEAESLGDLDFRDDESTASSSSLSSASSGGSSPSYRNFVTRSPRFDDPVPPVELLNNPVVEVGSDILGFILKNWNQTFGHHVQSFANLLNKALAHPDDRGARRALDMYSHFQSAPKIFRRLGDSNRIKDLLSLQPLFTIAHVPTTEDKSRIRALLATNTTGSKLHTALLGFLRNPPMDPLQWLPEFHRCFVWFLKIIYGEVKVLNQLRWGKITRAELPENVIDQAYNNLAVLKFLSWQSDFFASYISAAFATGTRGPGDTAAKTTPAELTSGQDEGVSLNDYGVTESETAGEEEDLGLGISTEFEGQTSGTTPLEDIHPCILELRLVTSNIRHIETLLNHAPRSCFRFQVIQFAPAGQLLKPWRELLEELFPSKALRKPILKALQNTSGKAFKYFCPGGPPLIFRGQAHCEAVLGCLFSLTKRDEDITWAGIPISVLDALGTCYSLLAPSKRCCPVCATIISLLSEEAVEAGGMGIHALSNHSITFPCAFPVGLPRSIRLKLLAKYRHELRRRLTAFVNNPRSKSRESVQSAALSQDSEPEIKPTVDQDWALRMYQSGWEKLGHVARKERWEAAADELVFEQLMVWWDEMSEDLKVGLVPPGRAEKLAFVPQMGNLALAHE